MLTTILGLVPAVISLGVTIWHLFAAHGDAMNTPDMKANKQAQIDAGLMEQAEDAVTEADKGNLTAERRMDAEQ